MNLFGFSITKSKATPRDGFQVNGDKVVNEAEEVVKSYQWVRNTLTTAHGAALPSVDPFLLSALVDYNGYHSSALHIKKDVTVGQGYECSEQLHGLIDEANEDDSFQDILNKFSLDLETYGSAYIEPVLSPGQSPYFYNSPALLTRVKPPANDDPKEEESYLQFVYKKNYGVSSVEFDKFKFGMRTGIRQLKLQSPNADQWYGKPEYLSGKKAILLNYSILTLAEKLFDNSLMLDKLFTIEGGKLTPEQKREMRLFMKGNLKGLDNAAKSLILELQHGAKLAVQDMNASIREAPYIDLRRENRDEIAASHRVPPRLLNIIAAGQIGATGEVEGQLKIFKIFFADPRQRLLEEFFKKLFRSCNLPDANTFRLLPMDITAGATDAQTLSLLTGGQPIITPAEAREDWLTEKSDHLSPKMAAQLLQYMKLLDDKSRLL